MRQSSENQIDDPFNADLFLYPVNLFLYPTCQNRLCNYRESRELVISRSSALRHLINTTVYIRLPSPVADCNSNSVTWRVSFRDSHTSQSASQGASERQNDLHTSTSVPFRVDESSAKVSFDAHNPENGRK